MQKYKLFSKYKLFNTKNMEDNKNTTPEQQPLVAKTMRVLLYFFQVLILTA